jgi:branched-chain amino acid aminotransferase
MVIVEEYCPFPLELYSHGLHVVTFAAPQQKVRLLGQPHLVCAKHWALENGCLEAILVDPDGRATATTEGMFFLVKDDALVVAGGHLPDRAGYAVATIAGESGLVVMECSVNVNDLLGAEEVFLAGTSCGVISIVRVNGQTIGSGLEGPITRQLRSRFLAVTRGEG